jgi:quinolinate synthase
MTTEQILQAIETLKKETDTVILAHTYQPPEIVDAADITGDSFKLSAAVEHLPNKRVVMCGVDFMAETVKILSPDKQVILASPTATCPMATQIDPMRVRQFKKENPHVAVCCYINTTAALKAECDICVTSSSAVKIVAALPQKDILFIPDQNLGRYVAQQLPEKNVTVWDGYCPVHNQVTPDQIASLKEQYPDVPVAIHPECKPEVVALCEMAGSTADIINFAKAQKGDVIIATEKGVAEYLNLHEQGDKHYIQACPETLICPDMKMTSLSDLLASLKGEGGKEVEIDETVRLSAKATIDKMLSYGG